MKERHAIVRQTLKSWANFVGNYFRIILIITALLTIVGGLLAFFRLGVINDRNAIVRQDSPIMKYYRNYIRAFQVRDNMVLVVESLNPEKNRAVVEELVSRLKTVSPQIASIYYKNDLSRLKPHALLFQDEAKLRSILNLLREQKGVLQQSPKGIALNSLLKDGLKKFDRLDQTKGKEGSLDELGLFADRMVNDLQTLAKQLTESSPEIAQAPIALPPTQLEQEFVRNSYLSFDEGRVLLIVLELEKGDAKSFSPYAQAIAAVRALLKQTQKKNPDMQFGLTGDQVLAADELADSSRDMFWASIAAFVLIAFLFTATYHEIWRPLLAILALACALVWSLSFAVLAVGHLNLLSQAFILMLLGLGIDLGIQIIGRYEEAIGIGKNAREALAETLPGTGLAVVTGGTTVALAFFTMCFNEFAGLSELGLIAGTGMIFCTVAALGILPSLLIWLEGKRGAKPQRPVLGDAFFQQGKKLEQFLVKHERSGLLLAIGVTLVLGAGIYNLKFDGNLLHLQNSDQQSVQLAQRLLKLPEDGLLYAVVVAKDLADALNKANELEKLETVKAVRTPLRFLPEKQEAKLEILKQIHQEVESMNVPVQAAATVHVAEARADLQKLLDYSRQGQAEAMKFRNAKDPRPRQALEIFNKMITALEKASAGLTKLDANDAARRLGAFQKHLGEQMRQDLEVFKTMDYTMPVTLADLPLEMVRRYFAPSGQVLVEVLPREDVWDPVQNEKFVKDVRRVARDATGEPVQNHVYIHLLRRSYVEAAVYALIVITLAVALHFLDLQLVLVTLLPLLVGGIWTVGLMGWLGIPFNPANMITLPLLVGIGVAYGVYLVDRFREEDGQMRLLSSSTGKAVALSTLTALCGFIVMVPGHYPGLVSLGWVMTLGISCCFIASIWIVPQALVFLRRKRQRNILEE